MDTKNAFLFEAFDIISCTTTIGVLYGIAFTLYCLCSVPLYSNLQKPNMRRRARFSFFYISFLTVGITGILLTNGRVIQIAYINYADFPGGPLQYEASSNSFTNSIGVIGSILDSIVEALTAAIQVGH